MVAADAQRAVTFSLSPGQHHDAPAGRELLRSLPPPVGAVSLIIDRAYEGDNNRQLALDLGLSPFVPPLKSRRHRLSFDKLHLIFSAFIQSAFIAVALRSSEQTLVTPPTATPPRWP